MKRNSRDSLLLPHPILMYTNRRHLIRLQERLRDLDSRASLLDQNRANRTGLKLKASPLRLVLERTFPRGAVTRNSSSPLNMPRLPHLISVEDTSIHN